MKTSDIYSEEIALADAGRRLRHNLRHQRPIRDLIATPIKEAIIVDEASMLDMFPVVFRKMIKLFGGLRKIPYTPP